MKTNSILFGIALLMGLALSNSVFSQDTRSTTQALTLAVEGSALLKVTSAAATTGIGIALSGATEAGAAIRPAAGDSTTRLKVSSLVAAGTTRTIIAGITTSMAASGMKLYLNLINPGNFQPLAANAGTSTEQELTDGTSRTIVSGIATCWSGTTTDDGYIIGYRYIQNTEATAFTRSDVTVTFTISE